MVSGRGAVKAPVAGGKASKMNSISGGGSLVLRDGFCFTERSRLGGIRIRTKKNCKDTGKIVSIQKPGCVYNSGHKHQTRQPVQTHNTEKTGTQTAHTMSPQPSCHTSMLLNI